MKSRIGKVSRKTKETEVEAELNLDGVGRSKIETGIGFLDHMLELFAFHGKMDLKIKARGDLDVDIHHTNEDVGIVLGQLLSKALGDRKGIRRFGFFYLPMQEALVRVVMDICGRAFLQLRKKPKLRLAQGYRFLDLKHFLEGFVRESGINLQIDVLEGEDGHHVLEAIFKALALALRQAVEIDPRSKGIPSSKGKI